MSFGAIPCREVRYYSCAVLCGAVPCCIVLRGLLYFLFSTMPGIITSIMSDTGTTIVYTRFERTSLLNHKKCNTSSQLSPAMAAQHRAMPCGAVPCGAVLCCATLCFLSNINCHVSCEVPDTRCRYVREHSSFSFLYLIVQYNFFSQITPVLPIRARHRQQAHSTAQRNQLCTRSSWHYQIASCTKSWVSPWCPLHIYLPYERSGRRQPPVEWSPCRSYKRLRMNTILLYEHVYNGPAHKMHHASMTLECLRKYVFRKYFFAPFSRIYLRSYNMYLIN